MTSLLEDFSPSVLRGLVAAIAIISIVGFGMSLMIPVLSLEMERRGISGATIGLQTTVMACFSIIGSLLAPRLIARMDLRLLIVAALGISSLTFPLYMLIENTLLWFPLRALNGFCFALLFTASEFWITSTAPEKRRGLVMGIYATFLSIGFALGPTVLIAVGTQGQLPMLVGTFIIMLGILPVLMPRAARPVHTHGETASGIFQIVRLAPVALLAAFVFGAVESSNFSFLAIWGVRSGLAETDAALLITMIGIGNVFLQIPIGLLADRWNRTAMLVFCALFSAGIFLIAPMIADNRLLLFALMLPYGGVVAGIYTIGLAILGEKFRGSQLAAANAAFVTGYASGMLSVPPLAGFGMEMANPDGYVYVVALLLGAYAIAAMTGLFSKTPRRA